jgi:hypothetical protein
MVLVEARVIDGTHLELARPIDAPSGGSLVVCVTQPGDADDERDAWLAASARCLAAAYGVSEPEYGLDMVKEPNPEYRA